MSIFQADRVMEDRQIKSAKRQKDRKTDGKTDRKADRKTDRPRQLNDGPLFSLTMNWTQQQIKSIINLTGCYIATVINQPHFSPALN